MMIEKGCASCKDLQEHYYWDHMDVSKIRFFKLMTGDFTKGISLPEKFTRKLNGQITRAFDLKTPSCETWSIGVEKNGDDLFLVSGWGDFVEAHELQENDLIVFTCSGNSSFDILIFQANGFEKMSSIFGNRTHPSIHNHFHVKAAAQGQNTQHNSVTLSDSEDITMTPLPGSPHNSSALKKSSEKIESSKQLESPSSSKYPVNVKHESVGEEDSGDEFPKSYYYYSMAADRLTVNEKEEIQSLVSVQLRNPAFVTVLTEKHCQRTNNTLIIPGRFAADHLEQRTHEIVLHRPNRKEKWMVRYRYSSSTRCFQNLDFFWFVRANKLREGDICIFELMKGAKRVAMTVHVVRKVDDRFVLVG